MANLIFEHLKKVYPNGFVSVDDVSLSIEDGEFVVFLSLIHISEPTRP